MDEIKQLAMDEFQSGMNCAETVLLAAAKAWGIESPAIPRIATPFGGGFASAQHACGALTGALMAIGLKYGRDDISGDRQSANAAAKQLLTWFHQRAGSGLCADITRMDFSDPDIHAAFRQPGGLRESLCKPLVADVAAYLAEKL